MPSSSRSLSTFRCRHRIAARRFSSLLRRFLSSAVTGFLSKDKKEEPDGGSASATTAWTVGWRRSRGEILVNDGIGEQGLIEVVGWGKVVGNWCRWETTFLDLSRKKPVISELDPVGRSVEFGLVGTDPETLDESQWKFGADISGELPETFRPRSDQRSGQSFKNEEKEATSSTRGSVPIVALIVCRTVGFASTADGSKNAAEGSEAPWRGPSRSPSSCFIFDQNSKRSCNTLLQSRSKVRQLFHKLNQTAGEERLSCCRTPRQTDKEKSACLVP